MYSLGNRNAGVDFLFENMLKDQFAQTVLGFNTVIRVEYTSTDEVLGVLFESDDFGGWMDASDGGLETKLAETFEGALANVHDRGFDLSLPCPGGVTDEVKETVSNLRDKVYCLVFSSVIEQLDILPKGYSYTDGRAIPVNNRATVYMCKTKEGLVATFVFKEPNNLMEKELYAVFLAAFQEVRRGRGFQSAPAIMYKKQSGVDTLDVSFMERHQKDLDTCSRMLYTIPDDLDYHIKASKTYFHHNMHVQCKEWLQTLNRADPSKKEGNKKGKKKGGRKSIR